MLCCTIPAGHICIVFHLLFLFITYVGCFEMISNVTEKLLKSCAVLSYGSAPALKRHHQSSLSSLSSPPSEHDSTRSNSPNLSFKSPSEICRFKWISQLLMKKANFLCVQNTSITTALPKHGFTIFKL